MKFSNRAYDVLKEIALVWLPAVNVLWVTLAKIWQWPLIAEISGTMAAIDVFLGGILKISTANYNKEQENAANVGE